MSLHHLTEIQRADQSTAVSIAAEMDRHGSDTTGGQHHGNDCDEPAHDIEATATAATTPVTTWDCNRQRDQDDEHHHEIADGTPSSAGHVAGCLRSTGHVQADDGGQDWPHAEGDDDDHQAEKAGDETSAIAAATEFAEDDDRREPDAEPDAREDAQGKGEFASDLCQCRLTAD